MDAENYTAIQHWSRELAGVFTLPDLKVALEDASEVSLYRKLQKLLQAKVLIKVKRGIYATPDAELTTISSRITPDAYISTGTVLAKNAIIGSIPARRVQAVKTGRPRTYTCELGIIEHLSIDPKYYLGFQPQQGVLWATPEKAFLDVCYYMYKRKVFSFDPLSDINRQALDETLINAYLSQFDQRFISFYHRLWTNP